MQPQTFVFIGRSGCGKGTQVELLKKVLEEKDPQGEMMYLETGANFREFVKGEKYSNKLSNEIYKTGARQPDFLAIWMWAHIILDSVKGDEHILFDGICRSLPEAEAFTTAMKFYDRKPIVIHLNVSREWSRERLVSRGRSDDKSAEEINKRLDWFDKDTMPAIEYFNMNSQYTLLDINGEQTIEEVHDEIMKKLGWQ